VSTVINFGAGDRIAVEEDLGEVHSALIADLFARFTRDKQPVWVNRERVVYVEETSDKPLVR
jgi:hypothetical protein